MDLLQPLEGRRRRLERIYYPGRTDGPIEEWRLRWDVHRFLEAIDNRAPDMADRLLRSCLNDGPLGRVVFLTDRHFVHCRGPQSTTGMSAFDEMLVELTVRTHDNSRQYGLFLDGPDDPAVLRCLLKVIALATCVSSVDVHLIDIETELPEGIIPAMQDFVSMARSRRTVLPCFSLWPDMARVLAFHCHPLVDLDLYLSPWRWRGHIPVLAEAIRANLCPTRLTLHEIFPEDAGLLAPALEATMRIEELTLEVHHYPCSSMAFDAIGRNRSIRDLVVKGDGIIYCRDVKGLWKSILKSTTILRVDASNLMTPDSVTFSSSERRKCAGAVAAAIRSNPRITRILFNPRIHDTHIMESRVVPILRFNKFRPIIKALFDGSINGVGRERAVSALLGSPLVRLHPELLYVLLKVNRENLLPASGLGRRQRTSY